MKLYVEDKNVAFFETSRTQVQDLCIREYPTKKQAMKGEEPNPLGNEACPLTLASPYDMKEAYFITPPSVHLPFETESKPISNKTREILVFPPNYVESLEEASPSHNPPIFDSLSQTMIKHIEVDIPIDNLPVCGDSFFSEGHMVMY